MYRRNFLKNALAFAAPAISAHKAFSGAPAIEFPVQPRSRIAIATYPFSKLVDPRHGRLPLLDFPQLVAEQFGVFAIEPLNDHFPSTDAAYLARLNESLERNKVRVANVAVGIEGSLYDPNEARRRKAMDSARHWIGVARAVNSPSIRIHLEGTRRLKTDVPGAAASLRALAAYAEQKQLVIHLENDSPTTEDAFLIGRIIRQAGTPWVRALPDFGNAMAQEKGEEFNYDSISEMFSYSYGICHAKSGLRMGKKTYRLDIARVFAIAKAAGFKGYYSMEYDEGGDPFAPTRSLIDATLQALS